MRFLQPQKRFLRFPQAGVKRCQRVGRHGLLGGVFPDFPQNFLRFRPVSRKGVGAAQPRKDPRVSPAQDRGLFEGSSGVPVTAPSLMDPSQAHLSREEGGNDFKGLSALLLGAVVLPGLKENPPGAYLKRRRKRVQPESLLGFSEGLAVAAESAQVLAVPLVGGSIVGV